MYLSYFGLNKKPFAQVPQTECLYPAGTTIEALENLRFGLLTQHSISLITSGPGLGKSLILQVLVEELANTHKPVYIPTTGIPGRSAFLQSILFELKRPYSHLGEQELRLSLIAAARDLQQTRLGIVLLLDELHLAEDDVLMEIRTLTTYTELSRPLFSVIGAGQIELEDRLTQVKHQAFNQRVGAHVLLNSLSRQETAKYIKFQVEWANGSIEKLFTVDAIELIAQVSEGIPRKINLLCDQSLMLAYVSSESIVDRSMVESTLSEIARTQMNVSFNWNKTQRESDTYPLKDEIVETVIHQCSDVVNKTTTTNTISFEVGYGVDNSPSIDILRQPLTSASTATIVHDLAKNVTPTPTKPARQTVTEKHSREIQEYTVTDHYTELDYQRQQNGTSKLVNIAPVFTTSIPAGTSTHLVNVVETNQELVDLHPELTLHNTILEMQELTSRIMSIKDTEIIKAETIECYDVVMPETDVPVTQQKVERQLQTKITPVIEEILDAQIDQTSVNLRLDAPSPAKKSRSFKSLFSKIRGQQ